MRRAAKADKSQREIVSALRAIGAHVFYIKEPVDLAVGWRKRTVLLEVKNPGAYRLTKQQQDFFATFAGEAYIVQDVQQALAAVTGKI
jgi:hypothetical protein